MNARILAVDDDPIQLEILQSVLQQSAYQLHGLSEPAGVLPLLETTTFDLILLDCQLPGISGIELCRQLKSDERFARIPIVFLTSNRDQKTLSEGFAAGAQEYVCKPFHATELLTRIGIQLELARTQRKLINKLKFCESMMSMLSHDLRGPVSAAADYLLFMIQMPLNQQEQNERIKVAAEAIRATQNLLDQTLAWSCLNQDEMTYRPAWQEAYPLLNHCLEVHRLSAEQKGITLHNEIPPQIDAWLDPQMVRTVMLNFIHNALKFTSPGGSVRLHADFEPGRIRLHVSDTGIGMSADTLAKVQKPSSMPSQCGTGGETGTGLGLQICWRLAEKMGGQLEVHSHSALGTRMSLVLPVTASFFPEKMLERQPTESQSSPN